MLDAEMTDCEELTSIVQESKYFTHLLIRIKLQELQRTKDHKKIDWKAPERLNVVIVMCVANKTKVTTKACKKNHHHNTQGLMQLSRGDNGKIFPMVG